MFGDEITSTAIRSTAQDLKLTIMSPWFQVLTLEGFVFMATADNLYKKLKDHLADIDTLPRYKRTKILIFNLNGVNGFDPIALTVFVKLRRCVLKRRIGLLWVAPGKLDKPGNAKLVHDWEAFEKAGLCEG